MGRSAVKKKVTLETLQKEVNALKKKLFVYETLQAEKEIREGKAKGPFKNVKELIEDLKK